MTISEDEMETFREEFQEDVSRYEKQLAEDDVPDDRIPWKYGSLSRSAFNIGIYTLLLEDDDDVSSWLEKSASYRLQKVRAARERFDILERSYQEHDPSSLEDTLETALCIQDEELIREALAEVDTINPAYPDEFPDSTPRYYDVTTLAAVVRGDDATAREFLSKLQNDIGVMGSDADELYEARALILEGILETDYDHARTGFERLIAYHESSFAYGSPRRGDELICRPAVALMLVARDRGFDIEFESEYVPERMVV